MEGSLQNSPKLGCPVDNFDAKYISGLSTILVATIQEAKDRISQIEYIFCSQIYPNFQSKSKSLQKIYSEAKKAAEDVWKEKENVLLLKIEQLQLEKQQVLEENRSLMFEKEKPAKVQDGKTSQLLAILESQQLKINELELELMQKSKDVDEGMELQNKLLHLVQSKASVLADKDKQRKEHEEKTTKLVAELNCWKKKVDEVQQELREKNEEIARKNELLENLVQKTEMLISDISNSRQLLTNQIHDKKLLTSKLEGFEENVGRLQEELRKKTDEVVEGRKLHEQLLQKVDLNSFEMLKSEPQLEECEKEKKMLLGKVEVLEENIIKLQMDLRERSDEATGGRDMNKTLLQQIELKASELMSEKKKRRDVLDAYKRLKSQYNFLCMKFGLTTENMLPQNKLDDESNLLSHQQQPITSPDLEDKNPSNSTVDCDTKKVKQEISFSEDLDDEKGVKSDQNTCYHSPTSKFFVAPKCPSIGKSAPAAGSKRPASSWRDTRSRQSPGGADPHDDFLDTPLENIRGNLNKVTKKEVLLVTAPKDVTVDSSDDETQDMNVDPGPQKQQMPGPMAGKRGFKYVEPVRKKAERQNLKGIECKQCKKFYDAVLPDNGGQDSDGKKQNFRCEHHEGVSRHRSYDVVHNLSSSFSGYDCLSSYTSKQDCAFLLRPITLQFQAIDKGELLLFSHRYGGEPSKLSKTRLCPVDNFDAKYISGHSTILIEKWQTLEENRSLMLEKVEPAKKSKEVDEGMALQNKLLHLVQSKASVLRDKYKQQKEHGEKTTKLVAELNCWKKKVDELQQELREKNEEIARKNELSENLVQKTEMLISDISNSGQLLTNQMHDKKLLTAKLGGFKENVGRLQEELRKKKEEVLEGRKLHELLLQKVDLNSFEMLKLHLGKVEVLDKNIIKLQMDLRERRDEAAGGGNMNKTILQQIELKASELMSEKKKTRDVLMLRKDLEDKKSMSQNQIRTHASTLLLPSSLLHQSVSQVGSMLQQLVQSGLHPLGEIPGGADPYGDFLDTPLENIRGNLNKATKEEVRDLPVAAPKYKNVDSSNNETRDMNVDPGPQKQQIPGPEAGKRGFKYVEPVRKKAERQNLKGIECKQCKKFYDTCSSQ
ncbi:hypothetical protein EZV62_017110 [Acer yangbiense]|uniref:DNA endonuclease activator Ctp1 C-terminal domain-containing protein n=1 Tax=Acer yangbiense TaxID=1000413 RepID=A0A5C7HFP9_9ROSI|nr:hypothetical protein EZV62_017110 [Acer yangbiense]